MPKRAFPLCRRTILKAVMVAGAVFQFCALPTWAQDMVESSLAEINLEILDLLRDRVSARNFHPLDLGGGIASSAGDRFVEENDLSAKVEEALDGEIFGPNPFLKSELMGLLDQGNISTFIYGATSSPDYGDRIIGGTVVSESRNPWQVALINARRGTLVCSGSHLGSGWVVTAAHCFFDIFGQEISASELLVHHGSSSLLLGARSEIGSGPFVHLEYDRNTRHHDIALFRMESIDHYVRIDFMEPPYLAEIPEEMIKVSGWGRVGPGSAISTLLQEVSVPIIPREDCVSLMEAAKRPSIFEGQICAGRLGADSCNGDSGGPLSVIKDGEVILVGVVSYGPKECGNGEPAIYSRVTFYDQWFTSIMR